MQFHSAQNLCLLICSTMVQVRTNATTMLIQILTVQTAEMWVHAVWWMLPKTGATCCLHILPWTRRYQFTQNVEIHVFQTTRSHIPETIILTAYRFKHHTVLLAASYNRMNCDCNVSIVQWAGQITNHGSIHRKGKKNLPFFQESRPALGSTQPTNQWILCAPSPETKRPGWGANVFRKVLSFKRWYHSVTVIITRTTIHTLSPVRIWTLTQANSVWEKGSWEKYVDIKR
jgi:hypothetical protein